MVRRLTPTSFLCDSTNDKVEIYNLLITSHSEIGTVCFCHVGDGDVSESDRVF